MTNSQSNERFNMRATEEQNVLFSLQDVTLLLEQIKQRRVHHHYRAPTISPRPASPIPSPLCGDAVKRLCAEPGCLYKAAALLTEPRPQHEGGC